MKRWEDNIREWTGLDFNSSQRAAEDRQRWQKIVADVNSGASETQVYRNTTDTGCYIGSFQMKKCRYINHVLLPTFHPGANVFYQYITSSSSPFAMYDVYPP